ncbi:MAG: YaaA family protein [Candidatus Marinimicrobia bacterium]|nr:YaaA family protein [Candidatus Neomarinimicrobiota bacterium]MBL7031175.1 YaaA family protein [Candidatus Neomarinimicrobiota bacterium]
MLVILSPSKTQSFSAYCAKISTNPRFKNKTNEIVTVLKNLSQDELTGFMSVSQKLGAESYKNIQQFQHNPSVETTKQAIFAYTGEVFSKINAQFFNDHELNFCQSHFRILSGLYGILRPFDLIQPYRLEMASKLNIRNTNTLTQFWKNDITDSLNKDEMNVIINLASKEYVKPIRLDQLKAKFISIQFKEKKNDELKVIGIFAKQARGRMIHYMVKNHLYNPEQLKDFKTDGYFFNPSISSEYNWVFTRG